MRLTGAQHLRLGADFEAIRSHSTGNVCEAFRLRMRMTETGLRRVGFIASKRVGNSVARNRARRLLREAFRNTQNRLPTSCDTLLIASPGILALGEAQVLALFVAQTDKCIRRLTPPQDAPGNV
jgi:ribonuclease P protein component